MGGRNDRAKPERTGISGLVPLMLALFLAGLFQAGYFERARSFLMASAETYFLTAGIVLKKIVIKGQVALTDEQIISVLGVRSGQSLIGFDLIRAQNKLTKLGAVKTARIQRLLPSTLLIEVRERRPFARWFHNGRTVLVDQEGVVLRQVTGHQGTSYPLVAGSGAGRNMVPLTRALSIHADLAKNIAMAEYVGHSRWNLHAKSGTVLKLPANHLVLGLARFVALDDWRDLLAARNARIDLRLAGQIFVRGKAPRSVSMATPATGAF